MKTHHDNISGAHKSGLHDKLIESAYIKIKKEIQTNDLTTQFKNLEKQEQTKSKSFY